MGGYAEALQKLANKMMGLVTESLGLGAIYLTQKMDQGMQIMAVNNFPPCPQPQLALGLPPHSDYASLTLALQNSPGLHIFDSHERTWMEVPVVHGALQVHVGDQLEVLSNGRYKSVLHRVVLSTHKPRISIVGLHAMGMDVRRRWWTRSIPMGTERAALLIFLILFPRMIWDRGEASLTHSRLSRNHEIMCFQLPPITPTEDA